MSWPEILGEGSHVCRRRSEEFRFCGLSLIVPSKGRLGLILPLFGLPKATVPGNMDFLRVGGLWRSSLERSGGVPNKKGAGLELGLGDGVTADSIFLAGSVP